MTPNKLGKLAAGTLLLTTRKTQKKIAEAVSRNIALAAADAHKRENEKRAAALAILLIASRAMASDVRSAIQWGRTEARVSARSRLGRELVAAGVLLKPDGHAAPTSEDALHAQMSAESLATQWRTLATGAILSADRKGRSVGQAIESTRDGMKFRTLRTATSESAQAYSEEHRTVSRELDVDGDLVARQWSALLDACGMCWPHDGETVGLDEGFSGGDEPGYVHSHCRCVPILVSRAASLKEAA